MILWYWLIVVTVFGACVGSFLNVVIYRIPAGLSVMKPLWSFCPKCKHQLASYDNVPVLGWLWLRGKCRYCKAPISMQYPMVEAVTAALFALVFYAFYIAGFRPDIAMVGLVNSSPVLVVSLFLVAALLAATVIDAKLFIIPLEIPYAVALVAIVVLPLSVIWLPNAEPIMPRAPGPWFGAGVGGAIGLAISVALLWLGKLPRSFADDPQELEADLPKAKTKPNKSAPPPKLPQRPVWQRALPALLLLACIALPFAGSLGVFWGAGALIALVFAWWLVIPLSLIEEERSDSDEVDEALAHPHPQREVLKELLFVTLPTLGAIAGYWLCTVPAAAKWMPVAPVRVLGGVLLGFLIGGGLIWFTRIFGTLAFSKEAMGLGDVHLLAAIGAVMGPGAVIVTFFLAPFFGLIYALLDMGITAVVHRRRTPIPYGPHLAGAAIVVLLFWPHIVSLIEWAVGLPRGSLGEA